MGPDDHQCPDKARELILEAQQPKAAPEGDAHDLVALETRLTRWISPWNSLCVSVLEFAICFAPQSLRQSRCAIVVAVDQA
jgi:hypothetical protein